MLYIYPPHRIFLFIIWYRLIYNSGNISGNLWGTSYNFAPLRWTLLDAAGKIRIAASPLPKKNRIAARSLPEKNKPKKPPLKIQQGFSVALATIFCKVHNKLYILNHRPTNAYHDNEAQDKGRSNIHVTAPSYPFYAVKFEENDRPQIDNTI